MFLFQDQNEILEKKFYKIKIYRTNILDVGTFGNIAIDWQEIYRIQKTAIDVSSDAIKIARENSIINKVSDKIDFQEMDILKNDFSFDNKFDVIISNPPYINLEEYDSLQKEIINYEPKIALTDFENGLKFYEVISQKALNLLNNKGRIYFEIALGQIEKVKDVLLKNNFQNIEVHKDYANIERVIEGEFNCE